MPPKCRWIQFLLINCSHILHEHHYLLPAKLQELKVILAWRAPRKLGGMLIPFRSDSPLIDDDTPLAIVVVTQT